MPIPKATTILLGALVLAWMTGPAARAEEPDTSEQVEDYPRADGQDAKQPEAPAAEDEGEDGLPAPALPPGKSLDQVLERAAQPPPADFPDPVPDDKLHVFLLGEKLEYRLGWTRRARAARSARLGTARLVRRGL